MMAMNNSTVVIVHHLPLKDSSGESSGRLALPSISCNNVQAPVNIRVISSEASPEAVGQSVYNAAENTCCEPSAASSRNAVPALRVAVCI